MLKQFACMKPCITNGKKKRKLLDLTKNKIEESLEYMQFYKNSRLIEHLNKELMIKQKKTGIKDKLDLHVSTDEEIKDEEDPNANLDQLFVTEKLEEVIEV